MQPEQQQQMKQQPHWPWPGVIPIIVGILWLVWGWDSFVIIGLISSVPGVILAGAGISAILWPGERSINQWLTMSAAVSVILAIILVWAFGFGEMLLLIIGGIACTLLGSYLALRQDAVPAAIPAPQITLSLVVKAVLDETIIGFFLACSKIPRGERARQDCRELVQMKTQLAEQGWVDEPHAVHTAPQPPETVSLEQHTVHGRTFDWLDFESQYEPPHTLPGAQHWQDYTANRRVGARVFEHDDGPRPWLMCIHGYRMGMPFTDFSLFHINHLHHKLGLNLIMPILPLHGPRSVSRMSGGDFLDGPMTNLFHAEAQALSDLRHCLAWLRSNREPENVGVLGYSLGGYNAALLAAFEPSLACVIAGIPATDLATLLWRHMPTVDLRYIEACGLHREETSELMTPVSPLRLPPSLARDRRYIFAATGDQLVPPEQPLALWHHWDQPEIHWYNGTHLSVRHEPGVAAFIDRALDNSGMLAPEHAVITS